MDRLSYAIVCALFASMAAIKRRTFSCALLWVDYKGIRTSRERRKQADYTVAVVQPKARLCSPEGSAHRWSTYQRMWSLEESPSSWPFWRIYRKKPINASSLPSWLRCEDEHGCVAYHRLQTQLHPKNPDDSHRCVYAALGALDFVVCQEEANKSEPESCLVDISRHKKKKITPPYER